MPPAQPPRTPARLGATAQFDDAVPGLSSDLWPGGASVSGIREARPRI